LLIAIGNHPVNIAVIQMLDQNFCHNLFVFCILL
jgi:hypothetical protein